MSNFFVGLKQKISNFSSKSGVGKTLKNKSGNPFEEIPRYPPFAKGLPLASVAQLLESQSEILKKVELEVGKELFDRVYLPSITAYCEFVHLLPASERDHHRGAGGLFRHGLEVALYALRYSKHKLFDTQLSPAEHKYNEPRWVLAGFIAGLVHDIGKPLSDYQVISEDGHHIWNPFTRTIPQWGKENGLTKYHLHWQKNRYRKHESLSSVVAKRVVTDEALDYLSTPGSLIIRNVFECITNQPAFDNKLYELVKQSDHDSTKRDVDTANLRGEDVNLAVPVDKYVIDGIKLLNIKNDWGIEFAQTPPLLFINGSLFITAKAIKRLTISLADAKIPGIPWDQKALTESLINTSLATPRNIEDGTTSNVWPLSSVHSERVIWGVKLKEWSIVFPDKPDDASGYRLLTEPELAVLNMSKEKGVPAHAPSQSEPVEPVIPEAESESEPELSRRKDSQSEPVEPVIPEAESESEPELSRRKDSQSDAVEHVIPDVEAELSRRKDSKLGNLNRVVVANLTEIIQKLNPPAYVNSKDDGLILYTDKIPPEFGPVKEVIEANKEGLIENGTGGRFYIDGERAFLKISSSYAKAILDNKEPKPQPKPQSKPQTKAEPKIIKKRPARKKKMADTVTKSHREVPADFDPSIPSLVTDDTTANDVSLEESLPKSSNTAFYDSKPASKILDNRDNTTQEEALKTQVANKVFRLSRVAGGSAEAIKLFRGYESGSISFEKLMKDVRIAFKDDRFVLSQIENIYMDKN
jgi:hypothetical protein